MIEKDERQRDILRIIEDMDITPTMYRDSFPGGQITDTIIYICNYPPLCKSSFYFGVM